MKWGICQKYKPATRTQLPALICPAAAAHLPVLPLLTPLLLHCWRGQDHMSSKLRSARLIQQKYNIMYSVSEVMLIPSDSSHCLQIKKLDYFYWPATKRHSWTEWAATESFSHWSQYWAQLILCLSFKGREFDRDRHGDRDCSSPHERGHGPLQQHQPMCW
jgi:hypothetical protein